MADKPSTNGKLASRPKLLCTRNRVFVHPSLAAESPQKIRFAYGELASGATYLESDPIGQLFYFNISNTPGVSQLHRGYWNKLYTYVDDDPVKLKDPTGLGRFDWLWNLFKEKTPEEITTKGLAAGFGAQCIAQNCGKSRDPIDLYGDCVSILNDWVKKMGAGAMGAINGITGDGGEVLFPTAPSSAKRGLVQVAAATKGRSNEVANGY